MEIVLQKLGNSTVAVLPPEFLARFHLAAGSEVTVSPRSAGKSLDDMIALCDLNGLNSDDMPNDIKDWDNMKPVGNEIW
ncbi:MAG: PbsX family transcriptional regulator [Candidatus Pacebacteria bacterium]|nr:PbsX family transcriptional regulator [Candidatus Paceibacterota bacterium]